MPRTGAPLRPLIWIVDDSPTQAAITERSLGERYRYERFADGGSVIERLAASAETPDLMLLDWVMPGLSGDEVCRYLRSIPATRELPIVMLTASRIATDDIVCALESGANDYVTKPFIAAELHARVGTILRAVEMQRAAEREHHRVVAINALAASLLDATTVERALEVIGAWLVETAVDGCRISLEDPTGQREFVASRSEEATAALGARGDDAPDARWVVRTIAIRDIATVRVWGTRDAASGELDASDVLMIDTCLEYSAFALEASLRSERERKTTRFHEEMVGIVGHDLRGPLSAFGLGLELLRDGESDVPTLNTIARLQRSNVRMTRIIEQLLDVTRARIGTGIPVTLKRMALRSLIDGVLDEVRLTRPGIDFRLRGDDIEGEWDRDRLEQVISNLAGNAVQYGRDGAPITFAMSLGEGTVDVEIHNENRGDPIPAGLLATVFDPFERGRTAGNAEGLGLGLYIVAQIVRAHRGSITVASDASGTTFRLRLPAVASGA